MLGRVTRVYIKAEICSLGDDINAIINLMVPHFCNGGNANACRSSHVVVETD